MELWSLKAAVTQILRLLCLFCVIPKPLSFLFWIHGVLPAWRLQVHGTIHSFSWGLGVWTHVSRLHNNSKPMLHSSSGVTRHWTSGWSGMWGKYSPPEQWLLPFQTPFLSTYLVLLSLHLCSTGTTAGPTSHTESLTSPSFEAFWIFRE